MTQEEYIAHLEKTIKSLENQVSNLTEMVILLNKKQFGHSSEKTPKTEILDNQLYLEAAFNEVEVLANEKVADPPLVDMVAPQKHFSKAKREQLITTLPVTEVECILEGEDKLCPRCKTEMKPIGKEQVRQELQFIRHRLKSQVMYVIHMRVLAAKKIANQLLLKHLYHIQFLNIVWPHLLVLHMSYIKNMSMPFHFIVRKKIGLIMV